MKTEPIALLRSLATRFKGKLSKQRDYDANAPGEPFSTKLRFECGYPQTESPAPTRQQFGFQPL